MSQNLPDDIIQARKLFEKYEKTEDHETRAGYFSEAIGMLKGYEEDNPDSPQKTLICNLKKTYLRKMIRELPSIPAETMMEWYRYVLALVAAGPETLASITLEDPALKESLDGFIEVYRDEFNRLAERESNKKPKNTPEQDG